MPGGSPAQFLLGPVGLRQRGELSQLTLVGPPRLPLVSGQRLGTRGLSLGLQHSGSPDRGVRTRGFGSGPRGPWDARLGRGCPASPAPGAGPRHPASSLASEPVVSACQTPPLAGQRVGATPAARAAAAGDRNLEPPGSLDAGRTGRSAAGHRQRGARLPRAPQERQECDPRAPEPWSTPGVAPRALAAPG